MIRFGRFLPGSVTATKIRVNEGAVEIGAQGRVGQECAISATGRLVRIR